MSITIQNVSAEFQSDDLFQPAMNIADESTLPALTGLANDDTMSLRQHVLSVREFRPLRFALGLLSTACGVAIILGIGVRMIETRQFGEAIATPFGAVCMLAGVMLLGSGFGIMATASSGFDESEFDRLADAGNISAVSDSKRNDIARGENDDTPHRSAA